MWKKIGALSVSYSPRPGIAEEWLQYRPDLHIEHAGALDQVRPEQVPSLRHVETLPGALPLPWPCPPSSPEEDAQADYRFSTHLVKGQVVSIERHDLLPLLQLAIERLETTGVDAIMLTCTGLFPGLTSNKPLLIPHVVFASALSWIKRGGNIAVVCPVEGQRNAARRKWQAEGYVPEVFVARPNSEQDIEETGKQLRQLQPEAVILDCFGFDESAKKQFSSYVPCPILCMRAVSTQILMQCCGSH